MPELIKNHRNKNRYLLTSTRLWVRDFTKSSVVPEDINNLVSESDYELILKNELANAVSNIASIDAESIFAPNIVIVSDGYDFDNKRDILKKLSQNDVTIIGTNRSLAKWDSQRRMDWYLTNNPYQECMSLLPKHRYYPRCIVSTRTNPMFIQRYRARLGVTYKYTPTCDKKFSSRYFMSPSYYIDDYRNPICAAIGLAYRWQVQKLLLFCCDDTFKGERPGAEKLANGLWMYPQQNISHGLIEGNLHWLTHQQHCEVKVASHSAGPKCDLAPYITEEKLLKFFD